jgi:hypothetical protein
VYTHHSIHTWLHLPAAFENVHRVEDKKGHDSSETTGEKRAHSEVPLL